MKPVEAVPIPPPPPEQRVRRDARFAAAGEKRSRYSLPVSLTSSSPVGYRTRVALSAEEAEEALQLLSLDRPSAFTPGEGPSEQELFEECSLGLLSSRQSTNFKGHRATLLGPQDSGVLAGLLRQLQGLEAPVLDGATHTHVVFSQPYRTPFTLLLTFIGHAPVISSLTVPIRALRKRFQHVDDIPTIGYLQDLHLGILADAMERAAVLASAGARHANVLMRPFSAPAERQANAAVLRKIEELCGLSAAMRSVGWRVALVAQVGAVDKPLGIRAETCRKLGANLLAFRSERIQPGVNQEDKAPPQYQSRQDMDIPDALTYQAGRAAYNAFAHWTGCERERSKDLLLLERVDVLTPNGKERLREIRGELESISDRTVANIPLWADLPLLRLLSKNAARGRKAFALAGQRIYIGGIDRQEIGRAGIPWELAVRGVGAAAARSALLCELMGVMELPEGCDLLAGICLMAGPVNQNDIGKQFYGYPDLLAKAWPDHDPTSLLVWTLKAKTVADPIGNEEQLLNPARKGALVDLRSGPHELIRVRVEGKLAPMRQRGERVNGERAFHDVGNFVTDPDGGEIPGNRGAPWPAAWAEADPFQEPR
ncbi:MAG: hypothetical protein H6741_14245 [Alphaproteobacteria bacterium]|nr:hypothetical protein [Alphaproteobacteria bacterium]MCB9793876.1 hypothetical protein [Alphaproteobacteria bacterium]